MQTLYDEYDKEFLDFIGNNELRIPVDTKTGKALGLHARSWRKATGSTVQWQPAKGIGTVISYVEFHRQYAEDFPIPYTVALVELAEGPQLLARLAHAGDDEPEVGMAVSAQFDSKGLIFHPFSQ